MGDWGTKHAREGDAGGDVKGNGKNEVADGGKFDVLFLEIVEHIFVTE